MDEAGAADSSRLTLPTTDLDNDEQGVLPFAPPLSHGLFLSEPFEASTFLLTRKHVNLDDLRSELRSYLTSLRQQLVSIINSDYEDFINLGGSHLLGSEDQMSYRMRKPLEGISREIKEAMDELLGVKLSLESRLARRDDVRNRKATCRKMLGINEQIQKVEEMLLISSSTYNQPMSSVDTANGQAVKAGLKITNTAKGISNTLKMVDRCENWRRFEKAF